jgi:hypothetical protein
MTPWSLCFVHLEWRLSDFWIGVRYRQFSSYPDGPIDLVCIQAGLIPCISLHFTFDRKSKDHGEAQEIKP